MRWSRQLVSVNTWASLMFFADCWALQHVNSKIVILHIDCFDVPSLQDKKGLTGKPTVTDRKTVYQRHIRTPSLLAKSILEGNITPIILFSHTVKEKNQVVVFPFPWYCLYSPLLPCFKLLNVGMHNCTCVSSILGWGLISLYIGCWDTLPLHRTYNTLVAFTMFPLVSSLK